MTCLLPSQVYVWKTSMFPMVNKLLVRRFYRDYIGILIEGLRRSSRDFLGILLKKSSYKV